MGQPTVPVAAERHASDKKTGPMRSIQVTIAEQGFIGSIGYDPIPGKHGMEWERDKQYALATRDDVVKFILGALPTEKKEAPKRAIGSIKG